MKSRLLLLCVALAIPAGSAASHAAESPTTSISPVVRFSDDERTVIIEYANHRWDFARPIVSPWNYQPSGKSYWVAADGDDDRDGSPSSPFRTIAKAVSTAGPGDAVYVWAGTYAENLLIRKSGQEGAPIILSCAPGSLGKVKITPPKGTRQGANDGS